MAKKNVYKTYVVRIEKVQRISATSPREAKELYVKSFGAIDTNAIDTKVHVTLEIPGY